MFLHSRMLQARAVLAKFQTGHCQASECRRWARTKKKQFAEPSPCVYRKPWPRRSCASKSSGTMVASCSDSSSASRNDTTRNLRDDWRFSFPQHAALAFGSSAIVKVLGQIDMFLFRGPSGQMARKGTVKGSLQLFLVCLPVFCDSLMDVVYLWTCLTHTCPYTSSLEEKTNHVVAVGIFSELIL